MTESVELLFFDTFAHENSEELNLDLVQFPKPVYVTEVRIIPLGARVQADFPGGVRLGATNPSQFRIEFFVNDLGKPGASTFETLGGFEYNQNGCINLDCIPDESVRKIPTDGLVLRGWYTTITLAVYGTLTANIAEQIVSPVVTPALPAQPNTIADVQQIVSQNSIESEWSQENVQNVPLEYPAQTAASYSQQYNQTEPYQQEYQEYYNEVPKDPRSYHHTPETEWDNKNRTRPIETERDRERTRDIPYTKPSGSDHEHGRIENDRRDRDRERRYSRSHSRDRDRERSSRDYSESNRDRDRDRDRDHDRDWEHERHDYRDRSKKDWDRDRERDRDRDRERDRDRDRDHRERSYEHQDSYASRRSFNRDEREENRKRPRTPPTHSPKRPHTPETTHKELSPKEVEVLSEEEPPANVADRDKAKKETKEVTEPIVNKVAVKSPAKETKEINSPTIEAGEAPSMDVEEFEPILSDEDIVDDAEHYPEVDYDYNAYTNNDDLIKIFIPGTTELERFKIASPFAIDDDAFYVDEELKTTIGIADDFFKSSITEYSLRDFIKLDREIKEELVHLCENVMTTISDVMYFKNMVEIYVKTQHSKRNYEAGEQEILSQIKFVITTLIDWIMIALNYEMATAQDKACYKIRHIKCGVKLAEWCCHSGEFVRLLWDKKFYVSDVLLDLYQREYMALSIKLMILRSLDRYLRNKHAIEGFVTGNYGCEERTNGYYGDGSPPNPQNGYKLLVELLRKNPLVRLKFALNSILKKLNLYEVLSKLCETVANVKNNPAIADQETGLVVSCLEEILHASQNDAFALSQPKRFLPVAAQFDINRSSSDGGSVLVEFFRMRDLLSCFAVLLTHPKTMNRSAIKTPICETLCLLSAYKDGLEYLSDSCDVVNVLVKSLLQSEEDMQYLNDSEVKSHMLALALAYKLQCLYHVERLASVGKKTSFDCESTDAIGQLHALYCLTFTNVGKLSVAEVLGIGDYMDAVLNFLDVTKDSKSEAQYRSRKSPAAGYVVDLLFATVTSTANVSFLEAYTKQLLQLVNQQDSFEPYVSMKLNELEPFLKPLEVNAVLNYDNIAVYVDIIGKCLDYVTSYPGDMITSLQILQHLGISRHENRSTVASDNPFTNYAELKYKYVILQLHSLDGILVLTKLLQKITNYYEQPALHAHVFVSTQGVYIVNVLQPVVELLRRMLTYVVQCKNTNFKDLTAIPVLLQTYNLLQCFPSSSFHYAKANKIRKDIVETLLVYTQPVSDEIHEKDSLNKTLWTLMCGEVIKYITTAPYTFVAGLLIFSELLPLPLPIHTSEELKPEEVSWAINLRKLWSAHLHSHSAAIQELVARLCTTTNHLLLNLLRRVCVQLSDLAANSAVMIARGILDNIHGVLIAKEEKVSTTCNGNTSRLLNFLACLVTHSPLKCAVLQLLHNNATNGTAKGDEKYPALIESFCQILKSNNDSSPAHVQAQECVLSIVQSFCDTEITLLQNFVEEGVNSDHYLANALPMKEHLLLFIATIVEHLTNDNRTFVTYLPVVRILLLLTERDYGFYFVREHLNKKTAGEVAITPPFAKLLKNIEKSLSKDADDCLATLNILVQFLKVSSTPEEVDGPMFKSRSMKMSADELRILIGWKTTLPNEDDGAGDEKHPLSVIDDQLKEILKEDKNFENLSNSVSSLVKLLNSVDSGADAKEGYPEPVLPSPEPLLAQFAGRTVYTHNETVDERLTSVYWLSIPSDEGETEIENVTCDLIEMCRQNLPQDVNLIREVEKLCRIYAMDKLEQVEKGKCIDMQKEKMKRPFVTPVRGRGFARTVPQRPDLFRSRPPNTSRPPSLHVDDFVALETCGAQPTGPTGYNKISRELLATNRITRATRGRPFIASERAMQCRQMTWWGSGISRGPYQ